MPDFSEPRKMLSDQYYKIRFLDDGYPGKLIQGKIVPHPIYGVYVIRDYLLQYNNTGDGKYKAAAMQVADAAIGRMNLFHQSLVFWYPKKSTFNPLSKDYFSALTQAYYAEIYADLYRTTMISKYKETAEKVYSSLKIPASKGGVFHASSKGPSIQELPLSPNGYILNGWLSAICSIKKYAELLEDKDADLFWRQNLQTLTALLPLYDVPSYMNSRYTLNGIATIRIVSAADKLALTDVKVNIPGDGKYKVPIAIKEFYANYIAASSINRESGKVFLKNKQVVLQLLLSRYSYPQKNEILLTVHSSKKTYLNFMIKGQTYSPIKGLVAAPYKVFKKVPLKKGVNKINVEIPWSMLKTLGVPTTFKKLNSNYYNVYHFIHLDRLLKLYQATEDQRLLSYIQKWRRYTEGWHRNPLYKGVKKTPYNKKQIGTVSKDGFRLP